MLPLLATLCLALDGGEVGIMRENLTAVFALQPYLASPAKFRDPANADVILASLDQLGRLQHQRVEPTLNVISELFAARVQQARSDFLRGSRDAARLRLSGLTSLCLGCHARAPAAVAPNHLAVEHLELAPAEKARFLASARQFDAALAVWKTVLEEPPENLLESYDQLLALRSAVGVAVRAKDDAQLVLDLLARTDGWHTLSPLTRHDTEAWQRQATAWKAEHFVATEKSAGALFARAKGLLESTPAYRSVASDEEHLVVLQRAASYLNRALELEPKAAWRGEALYLLAVASAAALDPELWQLDELYLESCVREYPHSKLAQKCVDRLADRIVYQYTLGGVTQVPPDEGSRLGDVRALAH
jgi:hypothetical protein